MEKKNKFIVINVKRFDELNETLPIGGMSVVGERGDRGGYNPKDPETGMHKAVANLISALDQFDKAYSENYPDKEQNEYWVVNKDEPYADRVLKVIEEGEDAKDE